jgi:hypothetical protein
MPVMGFTKFERFFRAAGAVQVDRDDVKRYLDFVNDAIYDVLLIGQATAKANARDIMSRGTCRSLPGCRSACISSGGLTRKSSYNPFWNISPRDHRWPLPSARKPRPGCPSCSAGSASPWPGFSRSSLLSSRPCIPGNGNGPSPCFVFSSETIAVRDERHGPGGAARDGSVPAQIEPQLAEAGARRVTEPMAGRRGASRSAAARPRDG